MGIISSGIDVATGLLLGPPLLVCKCYLHTATGVHTQSDDDDDEGGVTAGEVVGAIIGILVNIAIIIFIICCCCFCYRWGHRQHVDLPLGSVTSRTQKSSTVGVTASHPAPQTTPQVRSHHPSSYQLQHAAILSGLLYNPPTYKQATTSSKQTLPYKTVTLTKEATDPSAYQQVDVEACRQCVKPSLNQQIEMQVVHHRPLQDVPVPRSDECHLETNVNLTGESTTQQDTGPESHGPDISGEDGHHCSENASLQLGSAQSDNQFEIQQDTFYMTEKFE